MPILVYPANIYLFIVNIRNTRKDCKICTKLTIKQQNIVIEVVFEHIP